ncbi:hypothetical protein AAC387_Pa02g0241 [Persea americana]
MKKKGGVRDHKPRSVDPERIEWITVRFGQAFRPSQHRLHTCLSPRPRRVDSDQNSSFRTLHLCRSGPGDFPRFRPIKGPLPNHSSRTMEGLMTSVLKVRGRN